MNSNIQIRSNIYPVDTDIFVKIRRIPQRDSSIEDHESALKFIEQIRGKSALKKLAKYIHGYAVHEETYQEWLKELGVQEWQIHLFWHLDIPCSYAKQGHNPHGLISERTIGSKCQNKECRFFNCNSNKCGA